MSTYRDEIVAAGPVAYWRLNDALNGASDEMGNFPGTYVGGITRRVESFPGSGSFAAEFDGTTGYVEIPFAPSLNPSGPFSIEAWARLTDGSNTMRAVCASRATPTDGFLFWRNASGLRFEIGNYQSANIDILIHTWVHLVGVWENELRLYVDGEQRATGPLASRTPNPSGPFLIGQDPLAPKFWHGALADIALYDYALDEDQILTHYEHGANEPEPEEPEPPPPAPPESRPESEFPVRQQRQGRLVLGSLEVPLDNYAEGWACQELDLGYPTVREVMHNRPDQSGVDDQSFFFSSRVVSANITAFHDRMTVDDIAQLFAPFVVVSARPTLYYSIMSGQVNERSIKLRPADFSSPMTSPAGTGSIALREIHLAWIAPDPISYDAEDSMTVAFAGNAIRNGRQYVNTPPLGWEPFALTDTENWERTGPGPAGRYFDETPLADRPQPFPDGTWVMHYPDYGQGQTVGLITNRGDVPVRPILTVVGGITGPIVISGHYFDANTNRVQEWRVVLKATLHIDPSTAIVIDTGARTVMEAEGCRSLMTYLDWRETTWPAISAQSESTLVITGTSADDGARVEATWRSGYLT